LDAIAPGTIDPKWLKVEPKGRYIFNPFPTFLISTYEDVGSCVACIWSEEFPFVDKKIVAREVCAVGVRVSVWKFTYVPKGEHAGINFTVCFNQVL
jgi:hypothetical protein